MRVAVTGATGNLGTSVLAALQAQADIEEVVGIARRQPASQLDKVRWVSADIASDELALAFAGVDAVIHLAWLIQPSRNQQATWSTNVSGSDRKSVV